MQIAYMMGTSTSSALEAVYGDPKNKKQETESSVGGFSTRDTVSLSAEALELASRMNTADSQGAQEEQEAPLTEEEAGQSGGLGGGSGAGRSAAEIEAKIKELQQKISDTQSSAIPEDSKEAVIAGLQAQVEALMQELNALKAG